MPKRGDDRPPRRAILLRENERRDPMTVTAFILLAIGLIGATIPWMIVRTVRMTLGSMTALQARIEPGLSPLRR
jgi:hypothetical protein